MGVWIEIRDPIINDEVDEVAPFVGVWIEINSKYVVVDGMYRRSLRGSVD